VQWQAIVSKGAALTLNRSCPQRHPPSQGKFQSFIIPLSPFSIHDAVRMVIPFESIIVQSISPEMPKNFSKFLALCTKQWEAQFKNFDIISIFYNLTFDVSNSWLGPFGQSYI
jgi:hypothetical protein